MTILESFSLRNQQIALVEINGYPVVITKNEHEVRWWTGLNLEHASDVYGDCITRILEKEVRN